MTRAVILPFLAVATLACGPTDPAGRPSSEPDDPAPAAPGSKAPDTDESPLVPTPPGLSTESSTYRLRTDGVTERTSIPFAYRNARAEALYHPTCRPSGGPPTVAVMIERLDGGIWVPAWSQALPQCLSDPLVIQPGETFRDTLEVVLHPQDSIHPGILVPGQDVEGTYRLVWTQLLRTYDPDGYPFGEEIPFPERASRSFGLSR